MFFDSLRNILKGEKLLIITISYAVICFTGPFGGIIANAILKPWFESYQSRKASWPFGFSANNSKYFCYKYRINEGII